MEDPELTSLKKMLRSILQSSKEGVPARKIQGDYRDFTGAQIPYRKLGFRDIEDLMSAIPDTVQVCWVNGEKTFKAVADESTAHIAKMVDRQRSKKKKKGGSGYMRRPVVAVRKGMRPSYKNTSNYRPSDQGAYTNRYSGYIPQRYTFSPRPSAFAPRQTPMYSYKPREQPARGSHYQTPQQVSRRSVNHSPRGSIKLTFNPSPPPPPKPQNTKPAQYQVPPRFQQQNKAKSRDVSPYNYIGKLEQYAQRKTGEVPTYETFISAEYYVSVVTVGNQNFGSGAGNFESKEAAKMASAQAACRALDCFENESSKSSTQFTESEIETMKTRVKKLVEKRPNGLWCSRLPIEYKNNYGDDLPSNISDLVDGWPDIVIVEGTKELKILLPVPVPVAAPSTPTRPTQPTVLPHQEQNETAVNEIPCYKLPEIGSTVDVYFTYVLKPSLFYVHIGLSIQKIMEEIHTTLKEMRPLKGPFKSGDFVCAQAEDEYWYRAQLVPSSSEHQSPNEVLFIDFGNKEALNEGRLRKLPRRLYTWPVQAVPCSLKEPHRYRTQNTSAVLETYQEQLIKMSILDTTDHTCTVELFDENNKRLLENPKVSEPERLVFPEEKEWDVIVSCIVSGNQVVMRLVGDDYSEKLTVLEEQISKKALNKTYQPAVGDLCAACITSSTAESDVPWYRVLVQSIKGNQVTCEHLDYGGTEVVSMDQLRPLHDTEAELPYQAVAAYLTGLDGLEDNEDVIQELNLNMSGKPGVAIVNSREGTPLVTLYDTATDLDINMNTRILEVIAESDMSATLPQGSEIKAGYISYTHADGTVHLQVQGPGFTRLEELVNKITKVYASGDAKYFVQHLQEGRLVMALYSNGGWYRSIIRHILPNRQVLILFIDYGREDIVSCTCLRELETVSPALASLPAQAIAVTLHGLPPTGCNWISTAASHLENCIPTEELFIQTQTQGDATKLPMVYLSYLVDGEYISINKELMDANIWKLEGELEPTKTSTDSQDPSLKMASGSEGEVSDASLASSAAQAVLLNGEDLLNDLRDCGNLDSDPCLSSDAFRQHGSIMANKLAMLSLNGGDEEGEEDILSNMCPYGSSPKDLNSNMVVPQSAADYNLLPLPPRLQPVVTGNRVQITWAANPVDFTFVLSDQVAVINDMMNAMWNFYFNTEGAALTVDKPVVDGLYAGLYDDDKWYRVVIKNIISNPLLAEATLVSALLVDYGCFNLIRVTSLRQLTIDFRHLPFQASRACLQDVTTEDDIWSEKSISRFEQLTLEKSFVAIIHESTTSSHLPVTLFSKDNKGENIFVHQQLLDEGLAMPQL